ncbi:T9SS type A sorting domain-containing protein [Lentimicrobium sp. L6]|uniref:T9SS type A sorting domain-containing protein n=1 Tax=Lentimicrobium sp. L6 TaxID=2735916 RepID=UPI001554FFE5|nr:T9SS type A sorting domain-containing protein [Lentimicrobium sp. L6]NPD84238.1 T9SS type A sorting domain-containing protein [Lentimicrobium sp. L6]
MKKNLLLIIMLMMTIGLFAQNWAPINTTERFCYSNDGDLEILDNVLWVDSTKQMSDHEVYYFNKIVSPCDTCSEPNYMLANQPQFLLDQAKVYENGEWVFESYNQQFKLLPNAQLNEEWIFDEESSVTAVVSSLDLINVIGEEDSVKIISLSNNESFVLTKNHGVLQFSNYQLLGIEGRELGVLVPKFEDMFSQFEVGDVLCYYTYSAEAYKNVEFKHNYLRYEVTNIENHIDSLIFEAEFYRKYTEFEYGKFDKITYGDTVLVFYPNEYTESYPNELLEIEFEDLCISQIDYHKWGGLTKTNTSILLDNGFELTDYLQDDNVPELLIPYTGLEYTKSEYSIDFGFMEREIHGFEWDYNNEITGYLHNGDTLGEIFPVDMFVGHQELSFSNKFLVYPSPAKESIKVQTQETGEFNYKVFNISGQQVLNGKEEKSSEDLEIDISNLQNGVYILQFEMEQQLIQKKFVKQN